MQKIEATSPLAQSADLVSANIEIARTEVDAFADDIAKTNLSAILAQQGIQNVRSL